MKLDVVILGGGAAGLWLLDELTRTGYDALLLESAKLGTGQTIASQGIIHGGLKYTLRGMLTGSAANIREMPGIWRDCLAGRRQPNLSRTQVRSGHCYLWRTESLSSRIGMIGARVGLRVAPTRLDQNEIPSLLANCAGTVARLDEQVISPASFLADLGNRQRDRILQIDSHGGAEFHFQQPGNVSAVRLHSPIGHCSVMNGTSDQPRAELELNPAVVVFAAGAGNARLREEVGLAVPQMQRRPLHMVLVRGDLPSFNGHCVDGAGTRVTITSDVDSQGRTVWQLGGQIAEQGVASDAPSLIEFAFRELATILPSLDLRGVECTTYRVDRAERITPNGVRPESVQIVREGNCLTAWPTKLALAPELSRQVLEQIKTCCTATESELLASEAETLSQWPRPEVALPPWETATQWTAFEDVRPSESTHKKAA